VTGDSRNKKPTAKAKTKAEGEPEGGFNQIFHARAAYGGSCVALNKIIAIRFPE
jgi:hypothetical protein